MASNEQLLHDFYSAFQRSDADAMIACYHPEVHFSDPVFTDLRGAEAGDMWRMLCTRGKDLRIEFGDIHAEDTRGSAHWEAWYTFATGRKVHNVIDATFDFSDGRIIRHVDSFDLKAWAAQALGPMGRVFGGTSLLQNKIRSSARHSLQSYRSELAGD